MTRILELRERLRSIYARFELYINWVTKFLIIFTALEMINRNIGYLKQFNKLYISLLLALLCMFLPMKAVIFVLSAFLLVHLTALSLEVGLIALCIMLLMFFMYLRFAPDWGYSVILTPILFVFKIPQILPVSIGLLSQPFTTISMLIGILWYYFLKGIKNNENLFSAISEGDNDTSKFVLALEEIISNKEMFLVLSAFMLTALIVYFVRRLSINRSWTAAICVGNVVNLIVMLLGNLILGNSYEILWLILGTVVSFIINFGIEFIMYNLDYSRIEKVQFEDDEYYYYVKAVPKSYVATKEKQIKKIQPNQRAAQNRRQLAEELEIDEDLLDD